MLNQSKHYNTSSECLWCFSKEKINTLNFIALQFFFESPYWVMERTQFRLFEFKPLNVFSFSLPQ